MSGHERFTKIAQRKWANEWFAQKNLLKKSKISFLVCFIYDLKKHYWKMSKSLIFCSFPLFWWAMRVNCSIRSNQMSDVSKSLRLLTKNEWPWAICSGRSEEISDCEQIARLLTKNERMSESLILLSESLICLFLDKQQVIPLEIKWANSQPW